MLVSGQSMLLSAFGSNFGSMFVMLDQYKERPQPVVERFFRWLDQPAFEAWARKTFHIKNFTPLNSDAIAAESEEAVRGQDPRAMITVLPPPPVRGVGRAGGFKIMIEDRSSSSLLALQELTDGLVEDATYEFVTRST